MSSIFSKTFLDNLHKAEKKSMEPQGPSSPTAPSSPPLTVQSPGPIPTDGRYVTHDSQGRLVKIDSYAHGKLDGLVQLFNPTTQKVIQDIHYKGGEREGLSVIYDAAGAPLIQTPYHADKKNGMEIIYSQGHILSETTYVKGVKSGPFRQFSPHNVLSTEGTYQNNVLDGPRTLYYPSGVPLEKAMYSQGHPLGTVTTFYPNGHIQKTETYDTTGKKMSVEKYDINGTPVTQKEPVSATN